MVKMYERVNFNRYYFLKSSRDNIQSHLIKGMIDSSSLARHISRSSSEHSGQFKEKQASYQRNQVSRSYSFNPNYHISEQQGYDLNEDQEEEMYSNHGQQDKDHLPNGNAVYEATNHQAYTSYRQMCKDIEFIEMLGDPRYVIALHEKGYFYNKDFREYLNGLKCFLRNMMLRRLIKFPEGLYTLELIAQKGFIQSLDNIAFKDKFMVNSLKRSMLIQKCKKGISQKVQVSAIQTNQQQNKK